MATTTLPPIAQNPAHAHVVATLQGLRQNEIESFLARVTGSHTASLLAREILFWFSPCAKDPQRPRATVYKHDRYWFCRTQEEWLAKNQLTRRQLETSYARCKDFLDVDHFMFAAQRRTHYSVRWEKLRELLENDRALLGRPASDVPELDNAVRTEPATPVCTEACVPSVDSLVSLVQTITHTERVRVLPPSVAPAALPDPGDPVQGEPTRQEVHVLLKATEGKNLPQKLETVRRFSARTQKLVGYLLIWQRAFEKEYPGRKHHFNDGHLQEAGVLADQGVSLAQFRDVLEAAWEVRGQSEGHDPLFMCRNHSRKLGLFCKHYTRMEDELFSAGNL